ncbi:hypothetical protein QFZ31_003909 [Neobacillus niacini]|nr:hypothetical protein [Neobacillus niacini]
MNQNSLGYPFLLTIQNFIKNILLDFLKKLIQTKVRMSVFQVGGYCLKRFIALKNLLNKQLFPFFLFLLLTNINPPTIFRIHVFSVTKSTVMENIKED